MHKLFQNKHQQDDTSGLSFISRLVVLHSTCFELQGAHKWLGWEDGRNGYHFENLDVGKADNIKMDFKKWNGGLDSIYLAQG